MASYFARGLVTLARLAGVQMSRARSQPRERVCMNGLGVSRDCLLRQLVRRRPTRTLLATCRLRSNVVDCSSPKRDEWRSIIAFASEAKTGQPRSHCRVAMEFV